MLIYSLLCSTNAQSCLRCETILDSIIKLINKHSHSIRKINSHSLPICVSRSFSTHKYCLCISWLVLGVQWYWTVEPINKCSNAIGKWFPKVSVHACGLVFLSYPWVPPMYILSCLWCKMVFDGMTKLVNSHTHFIGTSHSRGLHTTVAIFLICIHEYPVGICPVLYTAGRPC